MNEEGRGEVPSLSDDDVVDGCVALAEAGETDFEDHYWDIVGDFVGFWWVERLDLEDVDVFHGCYLPFHLMMLSAL